MNASLVLRPGSPTPFTELRAALEEHLFLHRAEASKRARSHGGLLARRTDSDQLEALRARLSHAGIDAVIVADDELDLLARARRATSLLFEEGELVVAAPGGRTERVALDDVTRVEVWSLERELEEQASEEDEDDEDERDQHTLLASAAYRWQEHAVDEDELEWEAIEDEADTEGAETAEVFDVAATGRRLVESLQSDEGPGAELFFSLYARSPPRAFRFRFGEVSYAGLGGLLRPSSHENFVLLLSQLRTRLPGWCDDSSIERFLANPSVGDILRSDNEEAARWDQWNLLWSGRDGDSAR